jgi:hypothetical protein
MGRRRRSWLRGNASISFSFSIPLPLLISLAAILAFPLSLHAWSEQSQTEIAAAAARLAPPDLARQIDRHRVDFRDGVLEPFGDGDRTRHEKNADGSGSLDRVIADEAKRAVDLIRTHRPFADVVKQLGRMLHFVADANHPLYTSSADPDEGKYAADFHRYVTSAEPRFATAYYGYDSRLDHLSAIPAFVARTLARSRGMYPFIGAEYRRVGWRSGVVAFDDRSTAFGVAAVSFSRALTDGASMLRLVWLEAGGADPLRRPSEDSGQIVKLKRGDPKRLSP